MDGLQWKKPIKMGWFIMEKPIKMGWFIMGKPIKMDDL